MQCEQHLEYVFHTSCVLRFFSIFTCFKGLTFELAISQLASQLVFVSYYWNYKNDRIDDDKMTDKFLKTPPSWIQPLFMSYYCVGVSPQITGGCLEYTPPRRSNAGQQVSLNCGEFTVSCMSIFISLGNKYSKTCLLTKYL